MVAEEVGSAYVSLVPSLKGFSRLVKRELAKQFARGIEVPVTPTFDSNGFDGQLPERASIPVELDPLTKALQAELQKVTRALAKTLAIDVPVGADGDGLRADLQATLAQAQAGLMAQVTVDPEGRVEYQRKLRALLDSTREKQTVKVELDTDVDKDRLKRVLERAAPEAAQGGSTLGRLFVSGFGGSLLNPLIGIPVVIAGVFSLPLLGAAVAGATLAGGGLGALFVGAFALRADEDLKAAVTGLGQKLNTGLANAAAPLKGPFLEALTIIGQAFKDIQPTVNAFFKNLGESGVIQDLARGLGGFLRAFTETGALEQFGKAMIPVLQQVAMALPDIGNAFAQFMLAISGPDASTNAADFIGKLLRGLADAIRVTGDIISFLTRLFDDLVFAFRTIATAIGWVVLGFKTLYDAAHGNVEAIRAVFQAFWQLGATIVDFVKEIPGKIVSFVASVGGFFKRLWDGIRKAAAEKFAAVVTTVKDLPAKIKNAVGNLGTLLLQAGKNVVQGLIDGIKSKFGALASVASSMAQTIRDFLPFSPAKEGPLSGSGNPFHSGQVIAGDVAAGVQSQLPTVASAADQLAGMFTPQSAGFGTSVGAAGGFTIDAEGDRLSQLLLEILRESIRTGFGGDPVKALGSARR